MEPQRDDFKHSLRIQMRFNDIDMMGHVNNAKLQEYFDLGRVHYYLDVVGGELFEGEHALVIASNKIEFLNPVLVSQHVEVRTRVYHLGNKSMKMLQHIRSGDDATLFTSCDSVMVCIRKDTHETTSLPAAWRDRLGRYEDI